MTRPVDPISRLLLFALRYADRDPDARWLADAVCALSATGTPLEEGLGLVTESSPASVRQRRRDELLLDLKRTCYAKVSVNAAAEVISGDFWRYRTIVWPHRQARLQLEPWSDPPSPAQFYFALCLERLTLPEPRQVRRILQRAALAVWTSEGVEMSNPPAGSSLHGGPATHRPDPAQRTARAV